MPFLPAAMKNSTKASTFSSVASGSLRARPAARPAGLGSAASFVASSSGAPPMLLSSAEAASSAGHVFDRRRGLHDHRERDVANLPVRRQQRAVFAGRDELDADAAVARIPLRAILDGQDEGVVLVVAIDRHRPYRRRHPRGDLVELVPLLEERLVARVGLQERGDDVGRIAAPGDLLKQLAEPHHVLQRSLERLAEDLGAVRELRHARFDGPADQERLELALVLDVGLGPPALRPEQRRLRDVDVAAIDQLRHLPVEERQEQRADVRTVHVRVRHDDDAVVAQLVDVEILGADAAAEGRDHRLDLVAAEHLVEARLFDVQDLALDRQDGLEPPVAALLGRAAGRFTLDDVDLALGGIALLAVGELAGQAAAVERALAPDEIARLARRLARPRGVDGLADDALRDDRVLFEELAELVVDDRFDDPLDFGVPQLRLRLSFELRPRDLDADDAGEAFADVVAADAGVLQVLREVVLRGVRR